MRRTLSLSAWTGGVDNVSIIAIEDLKKFASASKKQAIIPAGAVRIEAWFTDMKLVMTENWLRPSHRYEKPSTEEVPQKNETGTPNKRKRKTDARKKPQLASSEVRQLDLTEEILKQEKNQVERPKIEISTEKDRDS
jgi:hypothetical protein